LEYFENNKSAETDYIEEVENSEMAIEDSGTGTNYSSDESEERSVELEIDTIQHLGQKYMDLTKP